VKRATLSVLVVLGAALVFPVRSSRGQSPAAPGGEAVVGLAVRGAHRAYPATLFSARRVVNDTVGGMEVAIFHDPAHGVSAAWFRMVRGEPIEFSGAAVGTVADDLTTATRWDLATGVAVGGNLQGQRLVSLPVSTTSRAHWTLEHPDTEIFSDNR